MSYTPMLIVNYEDLSLIEGKLDINDKVDFYIHELIYQMPLFLGYRKDSIQIVTCQPELSIFNEEVRHRLYELEVNFVANDI